MLLTRRRWLALTSAGFGSAWLAACAPLAPPAAAPTGPTAVVTTPAAAPAAPKTGGTLRVGLPADIVTLDAHNLPGIGPSVQNAFDALTTYDAAFHPQPALAESWDLDSSFKQIKLNLRKGVQFHTGREMSADDVKWNMLRVRDPALGFAIPFQLMSNWFSVDAPDRYTVVLKSDDPRPALFDFLSNLNIMDPVTAQGPDGKTQVVATGPFVVSEWAAGDHLLLSRNPNYWRAGVPYLEAIRYSILLDTQAMMVQFESHALDAVWLPPARDAVRLANDPAYQTVALAGGGNGQALFLNAALPPYTNKNVRQAINYAVNRERYRTVAYSGLGDVEVLPWPPISAAFERARNATYAFDLDKAASLLRDSGEHVTDLELVYTSSPEFDALGQLLQSDLKTLGVNVTLTPVGAAAFNAQIQDLKQTGGILGFGYTRWNPTSFLNLSATFKPQGSITRYSSDHYSQLIDAGSKEPDDARRQALYSQINDMILDESFGIPVLAPPQFLLATTSVQNIQLSAQRGYPVYSDIWLA